MQLLQRQLRAEMERLNPPTPALSANNATFESDSPSAPEPENDPFEDTGEDTDEIGALTDRQAAWCAVISRLGLDKPHSKYANLGEVELIEMARSWANTLRAIPLEAIEAVYERVMREQARELARGKGAFPPDTTTFSAVWLDPAWDFWADLNRHADEGDPTLPALPAPAPDCDGPGAQAMRLQNEAMAKCGRFVCCACRNEYDVALTAVLDAAAQNWVCAGTRCDFSWPVSDSSNAPRQPGPAPRPRDAAPVALHPAQTVPLWLQETARQCELELASLSGEEFVGFSMWTKWFRAHYECAPNYDLMNETWGAWEAHVAQSSAA